ncbi:hypothetical protein PB2503_01792 [Parvularcula bermudensis HTCC2503]|uniref:C-methyltransferase domain-containing protein n=1 Tax=Parvularcula bermudensis (strain ATCC BAA-594 / HTCC2503 / KCTC 12087) TaxID=314260 RepID=E0TBU4_PARBH|nr:class I SAM-dependent methyltransferase [Parvularcula bermudensis]ADM08437.1 hypothetical protein PB2503_01792 [Parvularcula bermudensis HTCC2503]
MRSEFQSSCRLCGGHELTPAFTLDHENAWVFCGTMGGDNGCGLLQRATYGQDGGYGRSTELSWTEQCRLKDVVSGALEMMSSREGMALDIGCGAGHVLAAYPRWFLPVGTEAALERTGQADWGIGIKGHFLEAETQENLRAAAGDRGFDIISSVGYLETINDPRALFETVKTYLVEDGVFVVETSYSALALTRTLSSAFHIGANAIYGLATLQRLASETGFRIIRGSMSERAAGSLRVTLAHDHYRGHDYGPWLDSLARLWDEEAALSLGTGQAFHAYSSRLAQRHREIASFKDSLIRADEHAYVLGTCAPSFAVLSAADIGYDVISAHIGSDPQEGFPEIITLEQAKSAPADVLIAPSWRRRETLEQWYDQIMGGMRLVFLEPDFLVVDRSNYATELGRALAVTDGPGSVDTLRAALAAMRGPALRLVSHSA